MGGIFSNLSNFSNRRATGRLALALGAALLWGVPARAMEFSLQSVHDGHCGAHCPRVILAEGQIENSTPDEFLNFLRENSNNSDLHVVVLLNSSGGYVVAATELGQIFRRVGAATVVARQCLSACVYAFMGGVKRVAPRGTQLGIHRMYANADEPGSKVYDDGSMQRMLIRYAQSMGVSSDLIRFAEKISSNRLHMVSPGEMAKWRLASRHF